ncbi:hypothetical protein BDV97DRAFT_314259 [Delphinella strobiligena]|nr:hypothetical protein BDV97DRAFT_314259 [Delphinella strobiligena]
MVGVHVVSHLARRGVEALSASQDQFHIEQLKKAARLYEDTPGAEIKPVEMLPMLVTALLFLALFVSVRYTLGEVASTLAMIEQPQTTVVGRSTRVVDDNEPDAPLEKEEKEYLIDEEIIVIKQDPITGSIKKTMRHLQNIGGFTARWRGLSAAVSYHFIHTFTVNLISSFFPPSVLVQAITYVVTSVLLSKIHATWTMVMISKPSDKVWFRRIPGDMQIWKALVLPSAVFATAKMATIGLPMLAFYVFAAGPEADIQRQLIGVIVAAATMLGLSVLVLLPASVTLARIEVSFLPENEDTIVSFDRTLNGAKIASITLDGEAPVSSKSLFVEAWRSFDMSSRLRLIKFYVKMAAVQAMIVIVGLHVIMLETWFLGLDRLSIVAQSGSAQLQLAAMGVEQD